MLLTRKRHVRNRNSLASDRLYHLLRLVRRDHLVFQSLEKDHRTRQPLGKINRRAIEVDVPSLRIPPQQTGEILRLILVSVARHCFRVTDPKVTRPCLESVAKRERT